jgi:NADPH:quinone reductase-like Zn-dependent oxidoreductase
LAGDLDAVSIQSGLGGVVDGTLRTAGVFHEDGLVALPSNLNFIEGATLTCAGLTAWNALYGLNPPVPGQWVLVQGTGGVSLFGLQFAKAAGCRVIATTSSAEKEKKLKELGADHVINYKELPQWGDKAREITGGTGVHHILEVGGPGTMAQSLKAIAISGVISIIGFVGKPTEEQPTFLDALNRICIVRGILVGSRAQFEEMNRAIEANNIHPVVDQKVFKLDETKEAYEYQFAAKHVGKVCIEI